MSRTLAGIFNNSNDGFVICKGKKAKKTLHAINALGLDLKVMLINEVDVKNIDVVEYEIIVPESEEQEMSAFDKYARNGLVERRKQLKNNLIWHK